MLLQNVIALVSYQLLTRETGTDEIKQVYMGAKAKASVELGSTLFNGQD